MNRSGFLKYLGVEPVIFLYMMAMMLTEVIEESFYLDKACRVDFQLPATICDNISSSENRQIKEKIQVFVSDFYQWYSIVSQGIPVILSVFLGAWSDRVGRKIPLLLGLSANLFYSIMVIVNSLMDRWRLEVILWTACLPCALGGGNLTVFMAAFSYLADTTTETERTLRNSLMEVAYLLPMPIGVFLGSILFSKLFDQNYTIMFSIKAALLVAALLYSIFALEWFTAKSLGGSKHSACWCGLLNWSYLFDSIYTLIKARRQHRQRILILVILCMAFYTFQRDETRIMYLFTSLKFNWTREDFSNFRTLQSSLYVSGLLIGVPILTKLLKVTDHVAIIIGSISHIVARIVFISSNQAIAMYIGCVVATLGPIVAPILRSMTSKLVPSSELGKAFAALSVADTCAPLISGIIYPLVYKKTINNFPQTFVVLTIVSQIIVLSIGLYIFYLLRGKNMTQEMDENEINSTKDVAQEEIPENQNM